MTRWLSFVSTEIHKKVLWPIFSPTAPEGVKAFARDSAAKALSVIDARIGAGEGLTGSAFTAADAYLVWALMLMPRAGIAMEGFPELKRFQARHAARGAVREAVAFEKGRFGMAFA